MFSTGDSFYPKELVDVETPFKQRINYLSNNFKQSVKQLKSVGLNLDQILDMIQISSDTKELSAI